MVVAETGSELSFVVVFDTVLSPVVVVTGAVVDIVVNGIGPLTVVVVPVDVVVILETGLFVDVVVVVDTDFVEVVVSVIGP